MVIWIIIFSLAIFDWFYSQKYLGPTEKGEKAVFSWFLLFFVNYIPLALFDSYQIEISFFLNSSGLLLLKDFNLKDLLRFLWIWILNLLQYTNVIYWISFWVSGILSLIFMSYHRWQSLKAKRSALLGMLNSFFLLLYHFSAEKSEYFILFAIMLGIYLLTWAKIKYEDFWMLEFYNILGKYKIFTIINTVFILKRIFYPELDFFEFLYFCIFLYFSFIIAFLFMIYFILSYDTTLTYLVDIWKEFKVKRKNSFNLEENEWKICKIYGLLAIFTYFMYISYLLIRNLWGDFWVLKEILFFIGSGCAGHILVFLEGDETASISNRIISNQISVYCQIWVMRAIIRIIF